MTERHIPKDRGELAAEKDACSNSNLEVWNGFVSSFNRIFGEESLAISGLSKGSFFFLALACLIMDMNGLYANNSC